MAAFQPHVGSWGLLSRRFVDPYQLNRASDVLGAKGVRRRLHFSYALRLPMANANGDEPSLVCEALSDIVAACFLDRDELFCAACDMCSRTSRRSCCPHRCQTTPQPVTQSQPVSTPGTLYKWVGLRLVMPVLVASRIQASICQQALTDGMREYGDSWRRRAQPLDTSEGSVQTSGADSAENLSKQPSFGSAHWPFVARIATAEVCALACVQGS